MDTTELHDDQAAWNAGRARAGAAWLPATERRRHAERRRVADRRRRIAVEGVGVGGVGATVALVWVLVSGAWRGRLLETPLDLSAYLIHAAGGVGSANGDQLAALYVALQYVAFVPVGVLGVALVHRAWRGALALALVGMGLATAGLLALLLVTVGTGAVDRPAAANVAVGGLLAVLAMSWLLRRTQARAGRHPTARAGGASRRVRARRARDV